MLPNPVPAKHVCGAWCWRIGAVLLVLVSAGLHLAYFAHQCPLNLAPDEAHYWDWSRHLDWSYYSKGPLVAYLIRGGCVVAGSWSRHLTATDMLAVRLPAVICGSLLLIGLYILTAQVYRREGLAFAGRGFGADAACRGGRIQSHDHRCALHLLLGLGLGLWLPSSPARLPVGVARPRLGHRHGHSRQVHDDPVDCFGRPVFADDSGAPAAAAPSGLLGHDRRGGRDLPPHSTLERAT